MDTGLGQRALNASLACLPPLQLPKCHWLDDINTAGGKQCSNWPGLSYMPTPGIGGEINSIIIILGERKWKGWFPRVTGGYQNQKKENGHQVTKPTDVLDGGIHFSSNSKSVSNVCVCVCVFFFKRDRKDLSLMQAWSLLLTLPSASIPWLWGSTSTSWGYPLPHAPSQTFAELKFLRKCFFSNGQMEQTFMFQSNIISKVMILYEDS